jgi:KUP system potassium uptake protein
MEAAYGLSVTLTMMMTTALLSVYLRYKGLSAPLTFLIVAVFFAVESAFLVANLIKFPEGGWITFLGGLVLISMMWLWFKGRQLRLALTNFVDAHPFYDTLKELSNDKSLPQYATHLVYLTTSDTPEKLEEETVRSILEKTPKRADVYWFVHVKTDNEPFTMRYKVEMLQKDDVYFITFTLGFRIEPRLDYFFRLALEELEKNGEVTATSRHPALSKYNIPGDVRFVLHRSFLSYENDLKFKNDFIMRAYYFIKSWLSIREDVAYGLDASNVAIEEEPIVLYRPEEVKLIRED